MLIQENFKNYKQLTMRYDIEPPGQNINHFCSRLIDILVNSILQKRKIVASSKHGIRLDITMGTDRKLSAKISQLEVPLYTIDFSVFGYILEIGSNDFLCILFTNIKRYKLVFETFFWENSFKRAFGCKNVHFKKFSGDGVYAFLRSIILLSLDSPVDIRLKTSKHLGFKDEIIYIAVREGRERVGNCRGQSFTIQHEGKANVSQNVYELKKKEHENLDDKKHGLIFGIIAVFRFANWLDILLMCIGIIFSMINGAIVPLMAIIFGKMTHQFAIITQYGFKTADNSTELLSSSNSQSTDFNSSSNAQHNGAITQEQFTTNMTYYSYYYVYVSIGMFISVFLQTICSETACERQIFKLRSVFFSQILRQDISWYDENEDGDLPQKLSDDIERIREGIGIKFSMLTQYISTFITGFAVGFWANAKLTLAMLLIAPPIIVISAKVARDTSTSSAREQIRYGVAGRIASEVLNSIKTVASFTNEQREIKRYEQAIIEGGKSTIKKYYIIAVAAGLLYIITYGSFGFAFWFGAHLIQSGQGTVGNIFSVFFSVMNGALSIGNALPYVNCIATAIGAASTICHIIDRKPRIDPYSTSGICPEKLIGRIEVKDVEFVYPARPEIKVLNGLTITIEAGKSVALIGASGAGKSTIIGLLLRFYDPKSGQILIDGHRVSDLNVSWLRKQIGVVSQEPILFGMSIAENIKYGKNSATQEEIIAAATLANAHDFIKNLPHGYDTYVGDKGTMLSGGQKQRIAIARALIRDPKILLLDEATSALDSVSESIVQAALDRAAHCKTTIIVAHRLSTIRYVDTIYALKDGKVYEFGNHDELMQRKGLYYNLIIAQQTKEGQGIAFNSKSFQCLHALEDETTTIINRKTSGVPIRISLNKKRKSSTHLSIRRKEFENDLQNTKEDITNVELLKLLKLILNQWHFLTLSVIGCLVIGISMPLFNSLYADVFYTFTLTGDDFKLAVKYWIEIYACFAIVTGFSHYMLVISASLLTEKLIGIIRLKAFKCILHQALNWFDNKKYAVTRLVTCLSRDPPAIKAAAGVRAAQVLIATISFVAALIIAFITGWKLTVILLLVLPLIIVASFKQTSIMKKYQHRDAELMDDAGKVARESLLNLKTVQALNIEKLFLDRYIEYLILPYKEAKKQAYIYGIIFGLAQSLVFVMYAVSFRIGAYFIFTGEMNAIAVYRIFFALSFCTNAMSHASSYFQEYVKAKLSLGFVFHLMSLDIEEDAVDEHKKKPEILGKVVFENINFSYPSRKNISVLRGLNLTIEAGQTVAIVGNSGCGKSTVINLLERFYYPDSGKIMIDDQDISTINVHWLRQHLAIVSQEPILFDCTIKENIAYGAKDPSSVTIQEIIQAAKIVNIHEFIVNLPKGYNTYVGERGAKLSGGQKQRIAIARAIIRDPKILLLDEATSALDTESEKVVQQALDRARKGRTSLVIAHRLSTIRNADVIAVIHQGKIVEIGTHKDLYNLQGYYFELIKHQ